MVRDSGSPGDHLDRTLEGRARHAAPTRDRLASPTEVGHARKAPPWDGLLQLQPPDGGGRTGSPDQGFRLVLGVPELQGAHRDDRLQTEVIGVLERELLCPDRLAALERHQEALLRGRRKETLRTRTRLEARLASVKSEQHAQLRSVAAGIDPVLVRGVVEELQGEEREIRDQLRDAERPSEAVRALAAIRRLREHADDLQAVLKHGDPKDMRKIFRRTIRSVTWLPEEERLELRLVLPEADDEPAEARVDSVRARGGTRTHTPFRAGAFKAPPSAIPAPGRRRL